MAPYRFRDAGIDLRRPHRAGIEWHGFTPGSTIWAVILPGTRLRIDERSDSGPGRSVLSLGPGRVRVSLVPHGLVSDPDAMRRLGVNTDAGVGRSRQTLGRRMISLFSRLGILLGTVESAGLPALYAATSPDAQGGHFYGPKGPGHLGGAPAQQKLYSRLDNPEEGGRVWKVSAELTGVSFEG